MFCFSIRKCTCFLSIFICLGFTNCVVTHADSTANDHAPIGVMGDHLHKKGEIMMSYRFMQMDMDKNYSGTNEISTSDIHDEFMIAPTSMSMRMHMLGGMYGVTDDITLMLMVPYIEMSMDHRVRNGVIFNTSSSGIGDVRLSGLFAVYEDDMHKFHLNFGMSFPTGSIDERDRTPMGPNSLLPYPMQLGSGTYDLLPGVTYNGKNDRWNWGAQLSSTQRLGDNDRNYTLGNRYEATTWVSYELAEWISSSFRLRKRTWGDIDGSDADLNPMLVQTADPTRQAGKRLDALIGVNLMGTEDNWLHDHRLAFEVGFPLHIDVNGPQLVTEVEFTVGWQKAW